MSEIGFDTSLFAANDPELARQVEIQCQYVGMYGLSKIKIPWAQARAFAQKRGKLYKFMDEWHVRTEANGADIKHSQHLQALQDILVGSSSYNSFYSALKSIIFAFHTNKNRLNRVYYGILGGSIDA